MNRRIEKLLTLKAAHVCAYLWARANLDNRAELCTRAEIQSSAAILDWHDLDDVERIPLIFVIIDEIDRHTSRQRAERRAYLAAAAGKTH